MNNNINDLNRYREYLKDLVDESIDDINLLNCETDILPLGFLQWRDLQAKIAGGYVQDMFNDNFEINNNFFFDNEKEISVGFSES